MQPGLLRISLGLTMALSVAACNKSPSSNAAKSEGGGAANAASASVPAIEQEARAAASAEIGRHWSKGPDGWTTAVTSGTPYAPDHYLRQFRDITIHGVQPNELDQSDRLNGIEWAGQIFISEAPYRDAGDQGIIADGTANVLITRQRGRWTQWINYQPEALRLQKVKGAWQIKQDTFLLRGRPPQPQDLSNAGVH